MTREEINRQLDEQEGIYYRAKLDGDVEKAMAAEGRMRELREMKKHCSYQRDQFAETVRRLEQAGWYK